MDPHDRRDLLRAVADGRMTPAEAAARLGHHDTTGRTTSRHPRPDDDGEAVERIRVRATGAAVTIIGDPTVATIDVQGDHELWSEGDELVIRVDESALDADRSPSPRSRSGRRRSGRGRRRNGQGPRATIRLNPHLPLRVTAQFSAVEITSMEVPVTARVNLGMLTLREVTAPFDARLRAGRLRVRGRLTAGESTIHASMSRVGVTLAADSDVAVHATAERGHLGVRLPADRRPDEPGRFVLGSGTASLDVTARMGSVDIDVAEHATRRGR